MGGWAANPPKFPGYSAGIGAHSAAYYEFMMQQQMAAAIQAQRNAQNAYTQKPRVDDNVIDLDFDQWREVEQPKQIEHK